MTPCQPLQRRRRLFFMVSHEILMRRRKPARHAQGMSVRANAGHDLFDPPDQFLAAELEVWNPPTTPLLKSIQRAFVTRQSLAQPAWAHRQYFAGLFQRETVPQ